MTRQTAKVSTIMLMGLTTTVSGRMTSSMASELRDGPTGPSTRASITREKRMGEESSHLQMVQFMKAIL
jgi:hypothetical protein